MKELKNGRSRLLECDYEILANIIHAKGFQLNELAEMMGYNKTYFNKVKARGKIGETCVRLLKERYGILPQQYNVVGYPDVEIEKPSIVKQKVLNKIKPQTASKQITVQVQLDVDQLSSIIKSAVIEAFNSL